MLSSARMRRSIAVEGVVQGVGFRPFVHGLASRLGLAGSVRNRAGGVLIEVEGICSEQSPRGDHAFRIEESEPQGPGAVVISPDVATCDDCLRELRDPA